MTLFCAVETTQAKETVQSPCGLVCTESLKRYDFVLVV